MNKIIRRRVLLGISGLLLMAAFYTAFRLYQLGAFTRIQPFEARVQFQVLSESVGPEALALDQGREVLYFISSNPCSKSPERGGIYFLPLNRLPLHAIELKSTEPRDFHPHGLSFLGTEENGYLLTNNHRSNGTHSVEIFEVDEDSLIHLKSISSTLLTSPNDLAAVDNKRFYVTIDGRGHNRSTRAIDTFLARKTGKVLFYDGAQFVEVVDNLAFPNGIAWNKQEQKLYIAESLSGLVKSYRVLENYQLQPEGKLLVDRGLDNLNVEVNGNLLVASHPNLLALSEHMTNPENYSPSRVYRIDSNLESKVRIFQHSGEIGSGISAAVSYRDRLILGSVCAPRLLQVVIPRQLPVTVLPR